MRPVCGAVINFLRDVAQLLITTLISEPLENGYKVGILKWNVVYLCAISTLFQFQFRSEADHPVANAGMLERNWKQFF